jgi:hypothetical protein
MNFVVYMTNLFAFFSYRNLLLECPLRTLRLQSSSKEIMHMRMASQFVLLSRDWRMVLFTGSVSCAQGKGSGRRNAMIIFNHLMVRRHTTFLKQDVAVRHTSM